MNSDLSSYPKQPIYSIQHDTNYFDKRYFNSPDDGLNEGLRIENNKRCLNLRKRYVLLTVILLILLALAITMFTVFGINFANELKAKLEQDKT